VKLAFYTVDEATRANAQDASFTIAHEIGPKRKITAEGFLVCLDVPVARAGDMIYGKGETPIEVGDAGYAIIERSVEELHRPEFIASFEGKPVIFNHPAGRVVTPDNYRKLTVGVVINPRKGDGAFADCIVADLQIMEPDAIKSITQDERREVSAGYSADYEPIRRGRGRQKDMYANHVALVKQGRCGSRCSIGDEQTTQGDAQMRANTTDNADTTLARAHAWFDRLGIAARAAWDSKDITKFNELFSKKPTADEIGVLSRDEAAHAALAALSTQFTELAGKFATADAKLAEQAAEIATLKARPAAASPAATTLDEATVKGLQGEVANDKKDVILVATDSALLADAFQAVLAGSEILVPGMTLPTFDKALAPKLTLDAISSTRRKALELANSTTDGRLLVERANAGRKLEFAGMTIDQERSLFQATVHAKKVLNASAQHQRPSAATTDKKPIRTIADLNAANAKRYGPKAA
jgi:hypothetical protein